MVLLNEQQWEIVKPAIINTSFKRVSQMGTARHIDDEEYNPWADSKGIKEMRTENASVAVGLSRALESMEGSPPIEVHRPFIQVMIEEPKFRLDRSLPEPKFPSGPYTRFSNSDPVIREPEGQSPVLYVYNELGEEKREAVSHLAMAAPLLYRVLEICKIVRDGNLADFQADRATLISLLFEKMKALGYTGQKQPQEMDAFMGSLIERALKTALALK